MTHHQFFEDPAIGSRSLKCYLLNHKYILVVDNNTRSEEVLRRRKVAALCFLNSCVPPGRRAACLSFRLFKPPWYTELNEDCRKTAIALSRIERVRRPFKADFWTLVKQACVAAEREQEVHKSPLIHLLLFTDGFADRNPNSIRKLCQRAENTFTRVFIFTSSRACDAKALSALNWERKEVYQAHTAETCAESCRAIRDKYLAPLDIIRKSMPEEVEGSAASERQAG